MMKIDDNLNIRYHCLFIYILLMMFHRQTSEALYMHKCNYDEIITISRTDSYIDTFTKCITFLKKETINS